MRRRCGGVWAKGGEALADEVVRLCDEPNGFRFSYELDQSIYGELHDIGHKIYHAQHVLLLPAAARKAKELENMGFGGLPICDAKTQYSSL